MAKREKAGITPDGAVVTAEAAVNGGSGEQEGTEGTEAAGAVPAAGVPQLPADGADATVTELSAEELEKLNGKLAEVDARNEVKASEQYRLDQGKAAYARHCEGRPGKEPWEELDAKRKESWVRAAL